MKTETTNQQAGLKYSARSAGGKRSGLQVIAGAVSCALALWGALSLPAQAQQRVSITFQTVSVPGAAETDAYAINKKNTIAGDYFNAAGLEDGMYLKGTHVKTFTCPTGGPFAVLGLNTAGMGVGDCLAVGGMKALGPQDGDILITVSGGSVHAVPISCICNNPEGVGINDSQIVLVLFQDALGNAQIGTYNLNTEAFTQLTSPEPVYEPVPNPWYPLGINNSGTLVLETINPASGLTDSWLYNGGTYTLINVPGALSSYAHSINNNGDIVYTFLDHNKNSHGALYLASTGQFYQFDDPNGPGVTAAFGINDEVAGNRSSKLRIVGDSCPGGACNAFEATVTIKP